MKHRYKKDDIIGFYHNKNEKQKIIEACIDANGYLFYITESLNGVLETPIIDAHLYEKWTYDLTVERCKKLKTIYKKK